MQGSMNHGLDIQRELSERSDEDWVFGVASEPCLVHIPLNERDQYLPLGETQRCKEDTQDCATRAPVNVMETKFNYALRNNLISPDNRQWLIDHGYMTDSGITFSDRFIAIKSGTTRAGNSLKAPVDAIHRYGLIPKFMLPLVKTMTWEQYYDPTSITPEMEALGQEFLLRFPIFYERVALDNMLQALTDDLLVVGAYAWPAPDEDGTYQPVDSAPNHAFVVFDIPQYQAFDNYPEDRKGVDYVKHLAPDYKFLDYGYRVYIGQQVVPDTLEPANQTDELQELIDRFVTLLREIIGKLRQYV